MKDYPWPYGDRPVWVVTHREDLPTVEGADMHVFSGDVATSCASSRTAGLERVWLIGGGNVVGQFLAVDRLDEVIFTVARRSWAAARRSPTVSSRCCASAWSASSTARATTASSSGTSARADRLDGRPSDCIASPACRASVRGPSPPSARPIRTGSKVRGRDLCGDLMGRVSFTEYFHLLLTGEEPTEDQRFFLDLLLVSIAEHGMMPTNVAARMTLAADPDSLHGAVAAGILGSGPVVLGTSEACARLLVEAQAQVAAGEEPAAVADRSRVRPPPAARCPGFGHPVHRPVDPRAQRILELADERGVSGPHVLLARCLGDSVAAAWGRPLPMNVSMPIAAVMLDLGFPPDAVKAVPILARTAGLLAHLAEEREHPSGFLLAGAAEEAVEYEPGCSSLRSKAGPGTSSSPSTTSASGHSSHTSASARPSIGRSSAGAPPRRRRSPRSPSSR